MLGGTYHGQKVEIFFLLKSAENILLGVFLSEKHIGDVIFAWKSINNSEKLYFFKFFDIKKLKKNEVFQNYLLIFAQK